MAASEAQILANRKNSGLSKGPSTPFGKERSRANSLKHGLTGAGVVLAAGDADAVESLTAELEAEMQPSGSVEKALVRRVAISLVRMDRSVAEETVRLNVRIREAEAEATARGEDPDEAGTLALFDSSKEGILARKYEAASERSMYRAMKELRQRNARAQVPDIAAEKASILKQIDELASFFPTPAPTPADPKPALATPPPPSKRPALPPKKSTRTVFPAWNPVFKGSVDVPITIGKPR